MTPYRLIAETLEAVSAARGKIAKIDLLAATLRQLDGDELKIGSRLLSGSPFAEWEQTVTSVGWATVARAASAVTGWDLDTIGACAGAIGDLGEAISLLVDEEDEDKVDNTVEDPKAQRLSIAQADVFFRNLAGLRKAAVKQAQIEEALARSSSVEVKYLIKTLAGGLRIGAEITTVEEAIALAFAADRESVARARRDSGDIGETALAARHQRLADIRFRLFHPIGFMLASPIEDVSELMEDLAAFAIEDKFDGIRAHAHKEGDRVVLFSRTLDEITAQFPEIAAALARLPGSFLLDGEIVAWGDDRPDSFFKLQRRLGRKAPEAQLLEEIPAAFIAYDCLFDEGETLFEQTWNDRRARLERIGLSGGLRVSRVLSLAETADLESLFTAARARGNEGLMFKRRDSLYQAGKRGCAWRKWKKATATLDVVVTAVEQGHGKRAGMLSDYTFAVRDGDRYVNIGKAYSGLSDEEIRAMGARFRKITTGHYGPVRAVSPEIVIEVAFDTLQQSSRHKSGFALRFPRIVRLRPDKTPADANTLDEVRELYDKLVGKSSAPPPAIPDSI